MPLKPMEEMEDLDATGLVTFRPQPTSSDDETPVRPPTLRPDPGVEPPMEEMEDLAATGLVTFVPPVPVRPIVTYGTGDPSSTPAQTTNGEGGQTRKGSNEEDKSSVQLALTQTMEELPDLAATGLVTLRQIDNAAVDEETYQELVTALPKPNDAIEMEFYLAARQNPLLREVMLTTLQEGIPPALQGKIGRYLRYFADFGIDEADDEEARRYLVYRMYGGSGHQNTDDPVKAARKAALTEFDTDNAKESFEAYMAAVERRYGVTFSYMFEEDDKVDVWDLANIVMAHEALEMAASVFGDRLRAISGFYIDDAIAFQLIFGPLNINLSSRISDVEAHAKVEGSNIIVFWNKAKGRSYNLYPYVLLHELGHRFNFVAGIGGVYSSLSMNETRGNPRSRDGLGEFAARQLYQILQVSPDHGMYGAADLNARHIELLRYGKITEDMTQEERINEYSADGVLNWIVYLATGGLSGFADTAEGQEWRDFINENLDAWIMNAIVYNAHEEELIAPFAKAGSISPIAGKGEVLKSQDPDLAGAKVRSMPALTGRHILTLREKETVLLLDQIEVEGDIPWNVVWAHGVNYVRSDLLKEYWIEGYPKNEGVGSQWFQTLLKKLVERMRDA